MTRDSSGEETCNLHVPAGEASPAAVQVRLPPRLRGAAERVRANVIPGAGRDDDNRLELSTNPEFFTILREGPY